MVTPISEPDAVIEAHGLTKIFRDFWGRPKARAVNGLDITVRRGEVFGLLGPNGSGKSTTVKLLLGLLYPTRGSIRVLGASPRDVFVKRRIGYLPEETYLYQYLTAGETLEFFGALFGLPPAERRRRRDQLLEMVGLARARDRAVGEFSKGMARRIGLAQALVNDPDLIILDEPTSGLDPIGCREVKDVIRLLASRGKTILLSSHLLADVEDVCDRVVILYGGRIRAEGSLHEILAVKDRTQITLPRLQGEELERLLAELRRLLKTDGAEIEVDQPSMNLEEFFLEVVRKAREASVETAGVQASGRIAEYLQGGEESAEQTRARLLDALTAETPSPAPAPAPSPAPPPAPQPDTTRLKALVEEPDKTESAPPKAEARPAAAPDKAEASKRLQELLGGGDEAAKNGETKNNSTPPS